MQCGEGREPDDTRALGLGTLYERVVARLESAMAAPPRRSDDWSIACRLRCTCELCVELAAFLSASGRQKHAWPLAKERRQHVHSAIDSYNLPVSHTTLRRGSPHTLMLEKLPALFERDAKLRKELQAQLAALLGRRAEFLGVSR